MLALKTLILFLKREDKSQSLAEFEISHLLINLADLNSAATSSTDYKLLRIKAAVYFYNNKDVLKILNNLNVNNLTSDHEFESLKKN